MSIDILNQKEIVHILVVLVFLPPAVPSVIDKKEGIFGIVFVHKRSEMGVELLLMPTSLIKKCFDDSKLVSLLKNAPKPFHLGNASVIRGTCD